jgi:hypothetical protein
LLKLEDCCPRIRIAVVRGHRESPTARALN